MFALAVTDTLTADSARAPRSEQGLLATEYAADGVEQLRVGQAPGPLDASLGLTVRQVAPLEGHPGLVRIDVSVARAGATPGRSR